MSHDAAQELIARMVREYPPPTHLRDDPEARQLLLADYANALAPFDKSTLENAWTSVLAHHPYWVWPNPGLIAEACRQCAPRPAPSSEKEQRREKATALATAYTARYAKTSHLAKIARREGWWPALHRYVEAAAWVQAQLICKVQHIGWDAGVLLPDTASGQSSQQLFATYRETIVGPVARGQVRVTVPPSCIREWKAQCHAQQCASTPAGSALLPA